MFFNQDSNCVLKAQLTAAVATSQLEISVTYKDNTDVYHPDAIVATNNTTAVTLLAEPSSGVVNIVDLIKIYNPDTQANTVQILANSTVIFTATIGAGQSAIISEEGVSGLAYSAANTDLSNLTTAGKAKSANLAMPSSSYTDLSLTSSGSTYTAPADGYYYLYVIVQNTKYLQIATSIMTFYNNADYDRFYSYLIPVKKGEVITVTYNTTLSGLVFRFIYAQGSV